MRKALLFLAAACLFVIPGVAGASTLAYEGFNYAPGDVNTGAPTTASGFTGPWMRFIPVSADGAYISNGSLAYPGLITTANKAELTHNRLTENVDNTLLGPFAAYRDGSGNIGLDGTTLFLSFLLKQGNLYNAGNPNAGFSAFELWRGDASPSGSDANRRISIDTWGGHGDSGSNMWVTAWAPTNNPTASGMLNAEDLSTHFYVLKLNFGALNNDSVNVYVDPPAGGPLPGSPTATINVNDLSFDRIGMSVFSAPNTMDVDEIRFGSSAADVVPEPATASLLLCAASVVAMLPRRRLR